MSGSAADRPNIIWIICEDLGVELSCYGRKDVHTPHIDALASRGVLFENCHSPAPVCSPSRSAFHTGLYQTTTGTHHHRSHRGDHYRLPAPARTIMDRLRDAGYFTCNVGPFAPGLKGAGKTDFNFEAAKLFDGNHWSQRRSGQPAFIEVNFQEAHKGPAFFEARRQKRLVDPAKVELPPYLPDHPIIRNEFANYLDAIQLADHKVGVLLETLRRDKMLDNSILFFFGDNGRCLIRGKQWLYEAGTHVPLIVQRHGNANAGARRTDLCSLLDVTATSLAAAGIDLPTPFHGHDLLGNPPRREFVVTARDRCGEQRDRIRAVRGERFRYIRNFMPEKPYTQFNNYISTFYVTLHIMKQMDQAGLLNEAQKTFMVPRKQDEEFYDLRNDPHEIRNLAHLPEHAAEMRRHRAYLDQWMTATGDRGGIEETAEEYDKYRG
ncbi:MAG: sulfatase [Bryobacterales bacterium]|nr:sulfatase [Bryobacterales bacterium]